MVREKLKFQDQVNLVTDVLTVFASYVLAVVIRYKAMRSEPGLDTLSAPYLLVAFCYSVIISIVFQYIRDQGRQGSRGGLRSMGVNATGCLFFLGFFYVIGEFHFSRIALVLFWLISSLLLEAKWRAFCRILCKGHARETARRRVLLVGGGEVTEQYVRALEWDDACDFQLVGYVGKPYGIFYDDVFEGGEKQGIAERGLLGSFDQLGEVLDECHPDEVVFALEEEEAHRLSDYIPAVGERGIPSCLVPSYAKYVRGGPQAECQMGAIAVDLGKQKEQKPYGACFPGAAITAVFLILMFVIGHFGMGNVNGLELYESFRAFIFGILGFFVCQCLGTRLAGRPHARARAALLTLGMMLALICAYEAFYAYGAHTGKSILSDFLMTAGVVALCCLAQAAGDALGETDIWNYL